MLWSVDNLVGMVLPKFEDKISNTLSNTTEIDVVCAMKLKPN